MVESDLANFVTGAGVFQESADFVTGTRSAQSSKRVFITYSSDLVSKGYSDLTYALSLYGDLLNFGFEQVFNDSLALSDTFVKGLDFVFTDSLFIQDVFVKDFSFGFTDSVGLTDTFDSLVIVELDLNDSLSLVDSGVDKGVSFVLDDALFVNDFMAKNSFVVFSDFLDSADFVDNFYLINLGFVEGLSVSDVLDANKIFNELFTKSFDLKGEVFKEFDK